jgi:hypothetical protein
MIIPGGQIIGGMGGRIWCGPLGSDENFFAKLSGKAPGRDTPWWIDVEQWMLPREWINAECTHSGTYGAITRRLVAYDWSFAASLPVDQANMPEVILNVDPAAPPSWVNVAFAFYLGDVVQNVEAAAMGMTQRYYFAPAGIIQRAQPVLNAARDVIRMNVVGQGNSRCWLIPDEQQRCDKYIGYLKSRGWWV